MGLEAEEVAQEGSFQKPQLNGIHDLVDEKELQASISPPSTQGEYV